MCTISHVPINTMTRFLERIIVINLDCYVINLDAPNNTQKKRTEKKLKNRTDFEERSAEGRLEWLSYCRVNGKTPTTFVIVIVIQSAPRRTQTFLCRLYVFKSERPAKIFRDSILLPVPDVLWGFQRLTAEEATDVLRVQTDFISVTTTHSVRSATAMSTLERRNAFLRLTSWNRSQIDGFCTAWISTKKKNIRLYCHTVDVTFSIYSM